MKQMTSDEILNQIEKMFPNAHCELNYYDDYELLVAVMLSAQSTDVVVNQVTPNLFKKYPKVSDLAQGNYQDVSALIKRIGLYKTKASNLIATAKLLEKKYNGRVPNSKEELMSLPGVGPKTANVILSELFQIPAIAVDTHVYRVARRLRLAENDANVIEVELALNKAIKKERWNQAHHLFIFFGRYKCKARQPLCDDCPFFDFCRYQNP